MPDRWTMRRRAHKTYTEAFPDLAFEIRHEFTCGEHCSVVELRASGTHLGFREGIAPTADASRSTCLHQTGCRW